MHNEFKKDSNALNPRFYKELLYILGLKEFDKGSKITIELDNTQNISFAKHIASKLKTQNQPSDFETTMSHIILWLNRILFLKLIEANLLHFNKFDENLRFLTSTKIKSFKILSHLFFEVLAKDYAEREGDKGFSFLPYLNSSLFIRDEKEICDLSALDDDLQILPFNATQTEYKKGESVRFLSYLFEFLECFDFGKGKDSTPSDKLINSSVLGAMFEKLNGYQEGSFYTPNFITSYMCKESLSKIVVEKFNTAFGWDAKDLESLRKQIDRNFSEKEADFKRLLESIRICDPSVGSGHFLVSALNEMIGIYHHLGLLGFGYKSLEVQDDEILLTTKNNTKFAYQRSDDENHQIQITLFNLKKSIIENNLFGVDINPNSCNIARLRLWIELLKNAYYLNFAKDEDSKIHKLQTLPNIDINIKCGNSLISHFETYEYNENKNPRKGTFAWLKDQNSTFSNNFKQKLLRYNELVQIYKEKLGDKRQIDEEINTLKTFFKDTLLDNGFVIESLEKNLSTFVRTYGDSIFDMETPFGMEMIKIIRRKQLKFQPTLEELEPKIIDKKGQDLLALIHKEFEALESLRKSDTFEWRFAFPEVLDLETFEEKQKRICANNTNKATQNKEKQKDIKDTFGDFLGFDLVIGNPPYIDYRSIDEATKISLQKKSFVYTISKRGSIFVYFIEKATKLIHNKGYCIFINPINYICQDSGAGIREFIDANLCLISMIDVSRFKVFDSASAYTCINCFTHKNRGLKEIEFGKANCEEELNDITLEKFSQTKIENLSILLDSIATKIFKANYPQLSSFCDVFCALSITGFRNDVKNKKTKDNVPFLESSDIQKYDYKQGKFLHNVESYYSAEKIKIFEDSEIIFMARMTNFIRCCIAPNAYFGGKVNVLHNFKLDRKLILGILNSKLLSYFYAKKYFASHMQGGAFGFDTLSVGSLPIPKITKSNQKIADRIIALVDEILNLKAKDSTTNTNNLESEIDSLVYQLYNLTDKEIEIIEV